MSKAGGRLEATPVPRAGQDVTDLDELDPLDSLEAGPPLARPLPGWTASSGVWGPKRPTWAMAVSLVYLISAVSQVLYAGVLPLLPWLLPDASPAIGILLGLASLGAAVGVFRGREWGRWLAIGLAVAWLARDAVFIATWLRSPDDPLAMGMARDVMLPVALNATVLVLLLARWPRRPATT